MASTGFGFPKKGRRRRDVRLEERQQQKQRAEAAEVRVGRAAVGLRRDGPRGQQRVAREREPDAGRDGRKRRAERPDLGARVDDDARKRDAERARGARAQYLRAPFRLSVLTDAVSRRRNPFS